MRAAVPAAELGTAAPAERAAPTDRAAPTPLRVPTPPEWFALAVERQETLLVDHANCEKKAASTALGLMFAYPEDVALGLALSRLAREELRHYEQVLRLMRELGVAYRRLAPSRYAGGLRAALARDEPARRLDLLLCGALIEARSCERFVGLAPRLPAPLAGFYRGLEAAEARHHALYVDLARRYAARAGLEARVDERLAALAAIEAELVASPDPQFRFHSGRPVAA